MKRNILLIIIILLFLVIPFINAGAIQNQDYNLKVSCVGFTCSSVNVTIFYPNSTLFTDNKAMTSNNYYATYSFIPKVSGQYDYFYSDGTNSSSGNVIVTPTGNELTTPQIILYSLVIIILFFFLLSCFVFGVRIPFKNNKNMNNETVSINWNKYLKIFLLGMSYFFLLAIDWSIWNLTYAYAQWYQLSNIFHFIFRLLMALAIPVFIACWILAIYNYFNDKNINKFIKRMGVGYSGK